MQNWNLRFPKKLEWGNKIKIQINEDGLHVKRADWMRKKIKLKALMCNNRGGKENGLNSRGRKN